MSTERPAPDPRSARQVQQDLSREHASYDAYPDHLRPARVRIFLVAFTDEGESFDGEQVDTDGLSVREFRGALKYEARRVWLAQRVMEAHDRLVARIGPIDLGEQR